MNTRSVAGFVALAAISCGVHEIASISRTVAPDVVPRPRPGEAASHGSLFGTAAFGLPDGDVLTPDAAPGALLLELDPHLAVAPGMRAGAAVATALSPDGASLLVLTSGYDRLFDGRGERIQAASGEYVFVYDVRGGPPHQVQVLRVSDAFGGMAFAPDGSRFFVSGGPDEVVHEFASSGPGGIWAEPGRALPLGFDTKDGFGGLGIKEGPFAAGVAVTADGARLVVAQHENDSLTVVDLAKPSSMVEVALSPSDGAGGEFPRAVVLVGPHRAFVASQRDRELVEVDLESRRVTRRIPVGVEPTAVVANRTETRLFVANAGSDSVSVVDPDSGRAVAEIPTMGPPAALPGAVLGLRGSNPNALALSPDERTLYVTNGGNNTLAVIALDARSDGGQVAGLVPTGYYPHAVSVSRDGRWLYVAHGRSPPGPNPHGPWWRMGRSPPQPEGASGGNEFVFQLEHGGLLAFPTPSAHDLARLTRQAVANDFPVDPARVPRPVARLAGAVKHVVFVVGENRTYDQVLGDLPRADGDARLVHWGRAMTPNQHAIAERFVTLDRFLATGDVSGDGWQWTMGARSTDVAEKAIPVEYAHRGEHTYDWEGLNRGINVGLATDAERLAANPYTPRGQLPGTLDVAAPDLLLWEAALAAGKTARVYGVFCDLTRYGFAESDPAHIPETRMPYSTGTRVAFPTRASLGNVLDPYFRGFDPRMPDSWREVEWQRELDGYVARGDLPALSIVRLPGDHFGEFAAALDGVDTPDTQMADHDWALGRLVEALSRSPYWGSTVVFVVEDDAQNGSDHVSSHRTVALVAGGLVRRGSVVHTPYTTASMLRTIELLLGVPPLGQHDAEAEPMMDVLDGPVDTTPFEAVVPDVLRSTRLPLPPPRPGEHAAAPRHDASWWAAATAGFDLAHVDAAPADAMNRILYCGIIDDRGCTSQEPAIADLDDE
jgi:YVTN family beta-propeller protein